MAEEHEREQVEITSRVAKLEGLVSQLTHTVSDFVASSERWRSGIATDLSKLSDKTAPNWGVLAAWATVIIAVLGGFGTMVSGYTHQQITDVRAGVVDLDTKLQREFALALETVKEASANNNNASKERYESMIRQLESQRIALVHDMDNHNTRIERIENWQDTMNEHELQELRELRSRALFGDRQSITTERSNK